MSEPEREIAEMKKEIEEVKDCMRRSIHYLGMSGEKLRTCLSLTVDFICRELPSKSSAAASRPSSRTSSNSSFICSTACTR